MPNEEQVLRALERALGRAVNDVLWQHLVDRRYVKEVQYGEASIAYLVDEYQLLAQLVRDAGAAMGVRSASSSATRELATGAATSDDPDARLRTEILSTEAGRLLEVVHWRAARLSDLPNGLVAIDRITDWIAEFGEADWKAHGQAGLALRYCNDAEYRHAMLPLLPEPLLGWIPDQPARLVRDPVDPSRQILMPFEGRHFLRWRDGGEKLFSEIPDDGVLFSLKLVAYLISDRYLLAEEDAVAFVLTGTPLMPFLGEYRVVEPVLAPGRPYIRMTLDPGLSTREVAALYGEAKSHLSVQRRRPLRDRARVLVAFCYSRIGFPSRSGRRDVTWDYLRREWNSSSRQEWRSHDERAFRGAYVRALQSLFPAERYPLLWT